MESMTLPVKDAAPWPYPAHLIKQVTLRDGTPLTIRPIRPADMDIEKEFVKKLSDYSRYYRSMQSIRELTQAMLDHFTDPDYDREMALIAVSTRADDQSADVEVD